MFKQLMPPLKYRSWVEYSILAFTLFLSFRHFAPVSPYALYNTDSSIFVLMSKDFDWVKDLYFWGQSRNGALVSLITFCFHKLIPILDIHFIFSIVYYAFVVAGLWCFSTFLKSPLSRVAFGFFWLLPYCTDFLFVGPPYNIQLSLVGIALFFITKPLSFLNSLLASILFGASVWISDASIVQILALIPLLPELKIGKKSLIGGLLGFGSTAILIFIAKSYAVQTPGYGYLATLDQSIILIGRIIEYYFKSIPSNIGLTLISILTLVTIVSCIIFRNVCLSWISRYSFYSILGSFFVCVLSTWIARENSYFQRYLTPIYVWWMFSILLQIENFLSTVSRSTVNKFLCFALLIALLIANNTTTILTASVAKVDNPNNKADGLRSPALIKAIQSVEFPGGIIADYWFSYIWCDIDDRFACTPHDKSVVIQPKYIDLVKQKEIVYLVKESWLETFPEEIVQFGKTLKRVGEPRKVHFCTIAPYRWK
jgi:hypothetical protein